MHLLHPEAHSGQDDEAGITVFTFERQHHSLGDCGQAGRHGDRQSEGHRGQPGEDAGVAGQREGIAGLQECEVAAEWTGDGRWAVAVPRVKRAQLDSLETLCTEDMKTLQHARALVVRVILLVADGTLHIHVLPGSRERRVPWVGGYNSIPCHCGRSHDVCFDGKDL